MNGIKDALVSILSDELNGKGDGSKALMALESGLGEATPPHLPLSNLEIPADETVAGWKDVPAAECGEGLFPLGPFASIFWRDRLSFVHSSAAYFGEHGDSLCFLGEHADRRVSLLSPFLRRTAASALMELASRLAPLRVIPTIYDCYRPLPVQRALFEAFMERLSAERPELDAADLIAETQTYVSLPSPNAATRHASPHATGGAVDLTLSLVSPLGEALLRAAEEAEVSGAFGDLPIDSERLLRVLSPIVDEELALRSSGLEAGELIETFRKLWIPALPLELTRVLAGSAFSRPLDMGTSFDYFGAEAKTAYFEGSGVAAASNRRALYHLLRDKGFSNYEEEWWHFSMGDGMAAKRSGEDASRYHLASFGREHEAFEILRRAVWKMFPRLWSPR